MRGLPWQVLLMADHAAATTSRRDLVAMGFDPDAIDGWVAAGLMERTQRGELRIAGSGRSLQQELASMLWRAGPGARIGGALRCALAGIKGFNSDARDYIAIPPHRRVRGVDFPVVRTPLSAEDHDTVLGLPAVTITRGLIGACATHRPARIRVAHDDAKFKGLVRAGEFAARAAELGRAHGAPQARRIADALKMESEPERDLFSVFRAHDPRPECQVWVTHRGKWHRLDFAYRDACLALEYDGDDHERTREQDADRDLALLELDIITIRITKRMMRDPDDVRRRILAVREARLRLDLRPLPAAEPPWA